MLLGLGVVLVLILVGLGATWLYSMSSAGRADTRGHEMGFW